jgi:hypothetical protein
MSDTLAHINERITCRASTENHGSVNGVSGTYGYNIAKLNNWGRGNFTRQEQGLVVSREARRFSNAVRMAEDEHLIGKRSAFSCAEVNAVTILIGRGASLNEITIHNPLGSDRRSVKICDACYMWMTQLGLW